ncbi:MAG: alanine racemase [Candidatus Malihini olakiniferum]
MKIATAVISRRALRHNMQRVRQLAPNSRLVAIIKANAYGHGAVECAKTLQDADCFGVARLSEALALRKAGIKNPILLLEGFFSADDLPLLAKHQLETVVHSVEQLAALEQVELPYPLTVWMKLDTGMHRLGIRPDKAEEFYQHLTQCRNVVQPINIMSHFCCTDKSKFSIILKQIACFDAFAEGKPGEQSIAASGGILLWPQAHRSQVRPGIILYGISPLSSETTTDFGLQPAMTLTSHLIAVREHKDGESEGYDCTWTSKRDTLLGVVAIGYADGYPRTAPFGTPVLVNGREVPLVGQVSMDMLTVDLGPNSQDQAGNKVILWGESLPIERISTHTGVSAYELITRVTQRLALEYLDD